MSHDALALAGVWLSASETDISATHEAWERLYFLTTVNSLP